MATVYWTGNGQNRAQVWTITVTAVAVGGTLSATINNKTITYTCVTGDTTASAATNFRALLANQSTAPPEFSEDVFTNPSAAVILATARNPGTPVALTAAGAGGATLTITETAANLSESDVADPDNYLRAGVAAIPQNGDNLILADSDIPLLWNLGALNAVQLASITRYQSFTAQVGLPTINPLGYVEYRETYFKFTGPPAGTLQMRLGVGNVGSGPSLERYNVGAQTTNLEVIASGSASDTYAIRFLGTSADNTASVTGTSVAFAMQPAEVTTLASMTVDGGGSVALGSGVTFGGTLTLYAASASIFCVPPTVIARHGSSIFAGCRGGTMTALTAVDASVIAWQSDTTITTLTLRSGSVLDKSATLLGSTITNSAVEVDTCFVLDPNNTITWTTAAACTNACNNGPFHFGDGRTVKIT